MKHTPCVYCTGLLGSRVHEPWDTIIAETGRFLIAPTKGALVPGWLLVVSKQHRLCLGDQTAEEFAEALEAVSIARRLVGRAFGPATVFEHGPAAANSPVGCGIDHLHVHVAPLTFSLEEASVEFHAPTAWRDAPDATVSAHLFTEKRAYLLLQEPLNGWRYTAPAPSIPQFFRQAIAKRLGVPSLYDYRQHPLAENAADTLSRILTPASQGAAPL